MWHSKRVEIVKIKNLFCEYFVVEFFVTAKLYYLKKYFTMKRFYIFILLPVLVISLQSCDSGERKTKKFFKRLNAGEVRASSKYLWPEDHKKLYVFYNRFMEGKDLMIIPVIQRHHSGAIGAT